MVFNLGWITTSLTFPEPSKEIDSIDDLVESKLRIYVYTNWTEYVPTKLASQFVLVNFGKLRIPEKGQATIVTSDFVRLVSSDPQYLERYYNTSNVTQRKYHQVSFFIRI